MTQYLTVQQVADALGVSSKTVRRRIDTGSLPVVVLSEPGAPRRTLRVSEDELERYLQREPQST